MMLIWTAGITLGSAYTFSTAWWAALVTFLNVFSLWCVNYAAVEMERPFSAGVNGLPLHEEVDAMNECLLLLMLQNTKHVPVLAKHSVSKKPEDLMNTERLWDLLPQREQKSFFQADSKSAKAHAESDVGRSNSVGFGVVKLSSGVDEKVNTAMKRQRSTVTHLRAELLVDGDLEQGGPTILDSSEDQDAFPSVASADLEDEDAFPSAASADPEDGGDSEMRHGGSVRCTGSCADGPEDHICSESKLRERPSTVIGCEEENGMQEQLPVTADAAALVSNCCFMQPTDERAAVSSTSALVRR
eukprot:TRINITY_DN5177_c0_g2_i1.p1 TRINITY_DN5177_c0_g2~~TRINITY_DN5177_c0_g2_i1.p1  ORF type:complete len:301 (+),score=65.56 TRINITY_DN5177_c0_g2_i1:569-1471(+)